MNTELKTKLEAILKEIPELKAEFGPKFAAILKALEAAYQLGAGDWIDIEKTGRLPEFEKEVQICHNLDGWINQGYYCKYELKGERIDWFNSFDNQCPCYPTHWRELPKPPQNN